MTASKYPQSIESYAFSKSTLNNINSCSFELHPPPHSRWRSHLESAYLSQTQSKTHKSHYQLPVAIC
jgi:hypothetical protein